MTGGPSPEHGPSAPPAPPTDDESAVPARLRRLAEALGPATLATALLLYFGYIATRARYAYFGVPVEMTGRSNQDLMLDGMEVVFVPAAMIFLGVMLLVAIHAVTLGVLSRDANTGDEASAAAFLAYGFVLVGVLLIGRALIGIFVQSSDVSVVFGSTPLSLAFGPAALAYGVWIYGRQRGRPVLTTRLARNGVMCAVALGVFGLFWGSTQLAWAYGKGRGEQDAAGLRKRPEVVVDTREPLDGVPAGVSASRLGPAGKDGRTYLYRYRNFRMLMASGGRLFLVAPDWHAGLDQTVVLPYGDDIRVQLVAQKDAD